MNLEYVEIRSRLIEPRSNEVEGGESTGYRVQSDNSQEKQFGGEPCFDLMDLLGHTYI